MQSTNYKEIKNKITVISPNTSTPKLSIQLSQKISPKNETLDSETFITEFENTLIETKKSITFLKAADTPTSLRNS